jgi:hypothetical protein
MLTMKLATVQIVSPKGQIVTPCGQDRKLGDITIKSFHDEYGLLYELSICDEEERWYFCYDSEDSAQCDLAIEFYSLWEKVALPSLIRAIMG